MDTITITRKEFRDIVNRCNDDFVAMVSKLDTTVEAELQTYAMGLQNKTFAMAIEYELFNGMNKED